MSPEPISLTPAEYRLRLWLRVFAVLFGLGTLGFFVRPGGTVADLNRVGGLLGLGVLPVGEPDFWLVLAVANMATITAAAWLAAADVRGRRVLVYPIVVSKAASSATGLLLFLGSRHAFAHLSATLVDLPIAVILLVALRRATPPAAGGRAGLAA